MTIGKYGVVVASSWMLTNGMLVVVPDDVRAHYNAGEIERMCLDVLRLIQGEKIRTRCSFCQGFAAALGSISSGKLSAVYAQGCVMRAAMDMADPVGLPGGITDVGRLALADEWGWVR